MSKAPNDKRRAQRLPFIVQVEMSWATGKLSGYSTDVSVSGLFVKTDLTVPLNTEVRLEFVVFSQSGRLPVLVTGDVARLVTREESAITGELAGAGVRFRGLEQGQRRLIEFLGQRLETFQEPLPALPGVEVPLPSPEEEGLRAHWGVSPELENHGSLFDLDRRGSFFVESPSPAQVGTHVYLWFSLPLTPRAMPVKATATVTHATTPDAPRQGMVLRIQLSTLDIHIVKSFFRIRAKPQAKSTKESRAKDKEFYRSLELPPPKKRPQPGPEDESELVERADRKPSRAVWIAGGAAVLLILVLLWFVL